MLVKWFKNTYQTYKFDEAGTEREIVKWTKVAEKLSADEIKTATRALAREEFPPNRKRFMSKALGILDTKEAFYYANNKKLEDTGVHCAYHQMGAWKWKHKSDHELLNEFQYVYGEIAEKLLKREPISLPTNAQHQLQHKTEDYKEFKARIAVAYGKDVADKHCVHSGWTQEQCIAFIKNTPGVYANIAKKWQEDLSHVA